jgi:peptide/nickel transport system substrate-binding protein
MTEQSETGTLIEELLTRRSILKGAALGGAGVLLASSPAAARAAILGHAAAGASATIGTTADFAPSTIMRNGTNLSTVALIFDTLAGLDPKTNQLIPAVASGWKWNKAATEVTIDLRSDVYYHSGRRLTPADVIFSYQTATNPQYQAQVAPTVALAKKFQVTGKNQLKITLSRPDSAFELTFVYIPLIDKATASGLFTGQQVVGTGPFKFVSWTPLSNFQATRNPKYWQKGYPKLSGVTVNVYSAATAMTSALQGGQIDMAVNLVPAQAKLLADNPNLQVVSPDGWFSDYYVGVNTQAAPFTDARVRQAVAYALDRNRIMSEALAGFGTETCIPWSSKLPGIPASYERYYTYQPSKAAQLLKEAGVSKPTVTIMTPAGNAVTAAILNVVEYNLTQAGFNVNSQVIQATTFQSYLVGAKIPGLWINTVGQVNDNPIGTYLLGNAPLEVGANTSNWTDPKYKTLADDVVFARTVAEQKKANQALTLYMLKTAWHITVGQAPTVNVASKSLSGVVSSGELALSMTGATKS